MAHTFTHGTGRRPVPASTEHPRYLVCLRAFTLSRQLIPIPCQKSAWVLPFLIRFGQDLNMGQRPKLKSDEKWEVSLLGK